MSNKEETKQINEKDEMTNNGELEILNEKVQINYEEK